MSRRVLVVCGSRALSQTPRARRWSHARILTHLSWLLDGDDPLLVHGGCEESPDAWSDTLASALWIRRRIYEANGSLVLCAAEPLDYEHRRWHPTRPASPLDRNRYMVKDVAKGCVGMDVRVAGLAAPWATTHGTDHTLTEAQRAGLVTVREECPAQYGPTKGAL